MPASTIKRFTDLHVGRFLQAMKSIDDRLQAGSETPEQLAAELGSAIRSQSAACLELEEELGPGETLTAAQADFQNAIDPWFSAKLVHGASKVKAAWISW